jgi:hypothetical protein
VGFVQLPDWTYSPVKNNLADAQKKAASGVAPRCASQGELEMYEGAYGITVPLKRMVGLLRNWCCKAFSPFAVPSLPLGLKRCCPVRCCPVRCCPVRCCS